MNDDIYAEAVVEVAPHFVEVGCRRADQNPRCAACSALTRKRHGRRDVPRLVIGPISGPRIRPPVRPRSSSPVGPPPTVGPVGTAGDVRDLGTRNRTRTSAYTSDPAKLLGINPVGSPQTCVQRFDFRPDRHGQGSLRSPGTTARQYGKDA